jgi:hypothetical protein
MGTIWFGLIGRDYRRIKSDCEKRFGGGFGLQMRLRRLELLLLQPTLFKDVTTSVHFIPPLPH